MTTNTLAALAAAPPVHPRDLILPYITRTSRQLGWPGISVCHSQAPSLELDAPPLSMHVVSLALNAVPRLMQRRDSRCMDGAREQWGVQILPAGHPSYWYAESVVENVFIALEPHFLQQVALEACDMDPARVEVQHVFGARDPVIKHLGRALWGELHTDGLGGQVYAASLAQVLAIHLLRTACARTPVLRPATGGLPRPTLRRVLAYISDHLAQPITLADLAALVPMDPYRFLKTFRQAMGVTPHQYLLARRTERVQAPLKDSPMPIADVAFQVDLRTPSPLHLALPPPDGCDSHRLPPCRAVNGGIAWRQTRHRRSAPAAASPHVVIFRQPLGGHGHRAWWCQASLKGQRRRAR